MVFVVGAVAIDLVAVKEKFLDGTSNPSDIRLGLGGVGYRIFSNLTTPRKFITALAGDPISRWARQALEADGGAAIQAVRDKDAGPPLYLALMESGSLKVAASDFRIVEQALSLPFALREVGEPGPSDFLVLDANLSVPVLAGLAEEFASRTRVVFEPVSVEKAARHLGALRGIFLLTPTWEEKDALCRGSVRDFMKSRDIRNVLVKRGREGVTLLDDEGELDFAPSEVVEAPDTTGAGDLLVASLVSFLHEGQAMRTAVRSAMTAVEQRLRDGMSP
jgi:sugar/nucleoside kinase (ribokinase family)